MAEILVDIDNAPFLGKTASLDESLPRVYLHNRFSIQFSHYQYPQEPNIHGFIIREQTVLDSRLPDIRPEPPRFGVVECALNPDYLDEWLKEWKFRGVNYPELTLAMGVPGVQFGSDSALMVGYSFETVRNAWEQTQSRNWVNTMKKNGFRPTMEQWQRLIAPYNPFQPQT